MSFLTSKRVLVPVAVLAVGAAGFKGYGAYTRSQPIDYSRGGDDFGVLEQATPTPGTSASTAPVKPTATATSVPSALPRVDVTAAPSAVPAGAAPTRAATAPHEVTQVAVPKLGTYGLSVTGSEKVQFGPVSFCNQKLPSRTSLVIKKAAGESATSYDFDVPFFPSNPGQHDERHIYRYTPGAVYLDYEVATVTCQGVRQSSETSFKPEQPRVKLPLSVGASWHYKGGGADRLEDATWKVLRTEALVVAGQRVLTYVISTKTSFTGGESGTRDQTWWYAPDWAMPVKWHEKQSGHRSGASYTGDITATVTSRP